MAQSRLMELTVGLFVCLGLAALLLMTMQVSTANGVRGGETYTVLARFTNIGSLRSRAPVTLAGVRIGRVGDIQINPETFDAEVELVINSEYDFMPEDTSANIYTAGLLGEQYIALEPGGSPRNLEDGDRLRFTQSALVLERLIGRFLSSMGQD